MYHGVSVFSVMTLNNNQETLSPDSDTCVCHNDTCVSLLVKRKLEMEKRAVRGLFSGES